MAWDTGNPRDFGHSLRRDFVPHGDGAAADAQFSRNPLHQAPLGADKVHAVSHGGRISPPERSAQAVLLRTPYRIIAQAADMELSDVIRGARAKQNLTQRQVAKKLKVAPSAVAQWENGSTMPSIHRRADLAKLLNISFQKLLPEIEVNVAALAAEPEIWQLVQRLMKLTPAVREALLTVAVAAGENPELASLLRAPD